MKTQELKSYIDRILGNSVRLLLPSYWWKRAFGAVADSMVAKDEVKTINGESIVGEGDLKIDGSGALRVWVWDEALGVVPTEEQIAENIATYNKLMEGNHSSVILCVDEILPDGLKSTVSINADAQAIDSVGESYVVLQVAQPKMPNSNDMQTATIQLNADGTMVISNGFDSAPSGPLRVWVNFNDISELTPEQVAENVETYKAICEGDRNAVVLCTSGDSQDIEGYGTITSTLTLAIKAPDEETYDVEIYFDFLDIISGKRELATLILSQDGSLEMHVWEEEKTSIETYVTPFNVGDLDTVSDMNLSIEISVDLTELQSAIKNGKLILVPTSGGGFAVAACRYYSKRERYYLSILNYDGCIYYVRWDEGDSVINYVLKGDFIELGNSIGALEERIAALEAK